MTIPVTDLDGKTFAILAVDEPADTDAVFAGRLRLVGEQCLFCNNTDTINTIYNTVYNNNT